LADEPIELDPGCLDAHCMLLSHSDICLEDQVAVLCDLVMAGTEDLGHAFLRRHAGHLWSELEARPLLRTMGLLVVSLTESGDRACLDEAIEVSELMLHLDAEVPDVAEVRRGRWRRGFRRRERCGTIARRTHAARQGFTTLVTAVPSARRATTSNWHPRASGSIALPSAPAFARAISSPPHITSTSAAPPPGTSKGWSTGSL
jgi:hypothetical protein